MAAVPSHHPQSSPRSPPDPFTDPATAQRRPPPLPPKSTAKSSHMRPGSKSGQAPRDAHPDLAQAVRDTVVVRPSTEPKTRSRVARVQTAQSVFVFAISLIFLLMIFNIDVPQDTVFSSPPNSYTLSLPRFRQYSGKVKVVFQRSPQEGISTRGCDRPS